MCTSPFSSTRENGDILKTLQKYNNWRSPFASGKSATTSGHSIAMLDCQKSGINGTATPRLHGSGANADRWRNQVPRFTSRYGDSFSLTGMIYDMIYDIWYMIYYMIYDIWYMIYDMIQYISNIIILYILLHMIWSIYGNKLNIRIIFFLDSPSTRVWCHNIHNVGRNTKKTHASWRSTR